jgi:hypothetical protein
VIWSGGFEVSQARRRVVLSSITLTGEEKHLQSPMKIVQIVVEIDGKSLHQEKKVSSLLTRFGLGFSNTPAEKFKKIAHRVASITMTRFVTTVHMMRLFYSEIAVAYIGIILSTNITNEAARAAWINLQKAFEGNARRAADHVLAYVPFYLQPDATNPKCPLNPNAVLPLIWPLQIFGSSQIVTKEQQQRAQEGLLQIGERAAVPLATKLAKEFFRPNAALSLEVHMLHHAWHSEGNFDLDA